MRLTLSAAAAALVFFGIIWFLQGINVLPGGFMAGQIRWAVYGGIAVIAGVSVLIVVNWRRSHQRRYQRKYPSGMRIFCEFSAGVRDAG